MPDDPETTNLHIRGVPVQWVESFDKARRHRQSRNDFLLLHLENLAMELNRDGELVVTDATLKSSSTVWDVPVAVDPKHEGPPAIVNKRSDGSVEKHPIKCPHPSSRRIGKGCGVCGAENVK